MLREITKSKADVLVPTTFVMTDEMAERLRITIYNDRDSKGRILREALHRYLLWREENHDQDLKAIRIDKGQYGETAMEYPKVEKKVVAVDPDPIIADMIERGFGPVEIRQARERIRRTEIKAGIRTPVVSQEELELAKKKLLEAENGQSAEDPNNPFV